MHTFKNLSPLEDALHLESVDTCTGVIATYALWSATEYAERFGSQISLEDVSAVTEAQYNTAVFSQCNH